MNKITYNEAHAQPILSHSEIIILTVILMKELNSRAQQTHTQNHDRQRNGHKSWLLKVSFFARKKNDTA